VRYRSTLALKTGLLLGAALTITALAPACTLHAQELAGQQANTTTAKAYTGDPTLEDTEQHLGPFSIEGQNFSVVLHEKCLSKATDPRFAQTLQTIEIRDEKNAVLYEKTFTFGIEKGKLERSLKASASLLSGKYFTGLLITYRLRLSTGEEAEAWQVFGHQDGRYKAQDAKFRIFDKPLRSDYPMGNPPAEMKLVTPSGVITKPMTPEDETFEFRVWAGNFYVMLPVGVNFARGKLYPSKRCLGTAGATPRMHEVSCGIRVEAERKPLDVETTFLRLYRAEEPGEGQVLHLVLDRKSKIQILDARAYIDWGLAGDLMQVAFRELWLKVRIDDDKQKEGWIHSDDDFAAIGLPSRSPEP
jgi:hypothetical protein